MDLRWNHSRYVNIWELYPLHPIWFVAKLTQIPIGSPHARAQACKCCTRPKVKELDPSYVPKSMVELNLTQGWSMMSLDCLSKSSSWTIFMSDNNKVQVRASTWGKAQACKFGGRREKNLILTCGLRSLKMVVELNLSPGWCMSFLNWFSSISSPYRTFESVNNKFKFGCVNL